MKKSRILMGALALAMVAAIIIACTKEKETMVVQSNGEMVTVSKEDDMNTYLKQFKEKMQSASKGDESLSLEDARWHLEAVLNYTYGDAGQLLSDINRDTIYYNLPNIGNVMDLYQINEAFMVLSRGVENAFEKCDLPEKHILAIQTKFILDGKDEGLTAKLILSIGGFTTGFPRFGSSDYWSDYYSDDGQGHVYGGGKCGPYAGQCQNSGAPHELTKKANLRIPGYGCPSGYRVYTTDVSTVEIHAWSDVFLIDSNSPCGYMIYFNSNDPLDPSHNPSHCIPPEDMNYYLDKFGEIVQHFKPNGKEPISALYFYTIMPSIPGAELFFLDIDYANVHCEFVGLDE